MTTPEQIEAMQKQLEGLGIKLSTSNPPFLKTARKLGFNLTPPVFMPFWQAATILGVYFAVAWGIAMWLIMWSWQNAPLWLVLSMPILAGVLFGVFMAAYYRYIRRKHNLPAWPEYLRTLGS